MYETCRSYLAWYLYCITCLQFNLRRMWFRVQCCLDPWKKAQYPVGYARKPRAGILKQSMGARNRVGIGLSYRPAGLRRLAECIPWNRFLGSINVYKYWSGQQGLSCKDDLPSRRLNPFLFICGLSCPGSVKGTVSRDFLLQVFFMNHLPPSPWNNSRVISNFFENSQRYSQDKLYHDTSGKFATGINDTGGK